MIHHPELEEVEEILRRIQKFDPTGVGARDLRECLLLQLEQLDGNTPWLKEARDLITTHLHILGNKDFATLVRQTHLSESELSQVVALIRNAAAAARLKRIRGSRGLRGP